MKKFLLILILVLPMFISCTSVLEEPIAEVILNTKAEKCQEREKYRVDVELLESYLKLSGKSRGEYVIVPLEVDDVIVAYCVEYDKGWDVISADVRIPPVMMKSDSGECDLGDSDLIGLMKYIYNVCNTSGGIVDPVWSFLKSEGGSPVLLTKGGGSEDAYTVGMWRVIDTVAVTEVDEIPHIIGVRWSQSLPWNYYKPMVNGGIVPVGCGAVAAGQIIHHYRKTDIMGVQFPLSASRNGDDVVFSEEMNSTRWPIMATDKYDETESKKYVALMLSYLGQEIMGHVYNVAEGGTVVNTRGVDEAFNWGLLYYDSSSNFDFEALMSSLYLDRPVCMYSSLTQGSLGNSHVYIIDRYRKERTYFVISCEWDPDYVVSEEEYHAYDDSFFVESAGADKKEIYIDAYEYTFLGMNWGYDDADYDNRWYLTRSKTASSEDESGVSGGYDIVFQPYWETSTGRVDGVSKMYYNFRNMTN